MGSTAVTTISGLTLSGGTLTGSLTAGGSTGTSGYFLQSTGTGVQWAAAAVIPLTLTANSTGFSIAGGTTSKTLQVNNTITLAAGADSQIFTFPSTSGTIALLNAANTYTNTNVFNTNATQYTQHAATVAPTVDMVQITNLGFPIVTAGVSGIQVNYVGGAAAVEASASRVDITPGTTTGGIWNGLRVFPTLASTTGVTYNALKFDSLTAGAGTDNIIYVGTGYDNIINYNGTSIINGTGQLNLASVTGTLAVGNGGTGSTTSTGTAASANVLQTSPTITTPVIDSISASAVGAATSLHPTVTTGSIAIGAGLTTGALNIAASGTGITPITIGHTNATIALNGAITTSSTINKVTITAPTTSATLTLITGSTLATGTAASLTLSLSSAAATVATIPSGTVTLMDLGTAQSITSVKTFSTAPVMTTITSGAATLTLPTATGTLLSSVSTASALTSFGTNATLTTPTIDVINAASATGTTQSLFSNTTTGTINIGGASLTTGTINIGTAGTGVNPIVIGKSTSTITLGALPTAGFVKTSATGLLSVDTNTYLTTTAAGTTYSPIAGSASITTVGTVTSGSFPAANIAAGTLGSTVLPAAGTVTTAGQIGYMGLPQTLNPGAYTLTAADNGKHIYYTTTAQTLTIPANATLALPIGFSCVVINAAAVSTSIAITTDSLLLAGTGTTGTRTLAAYGMATLVKITATSWMISGNGLT